MKDPNNYVTYHDALLGVLVLSGLDRFPNDTFSLHKFFYKWRDQTSLEQLKRLTFDSRGPVPLSEEIYQFKSWMFMWDGWYTLVPPPPSGDFFFWCEGVREQSLKRTLELFSEKELTELKRIAEDFAEEFTVVIASPKDPVNLLGFGSRDPGLDEAIAKEMGQ